MMLTELSVRKLVGLGAGARALDLISPYWEVTPLAVETDRQPPC